jgi:hypothetical protein
MGFAPLIAACNTLLSQNPGTLPDLSGAVTEYFQPMTFKRLVKTVVNFKNSEAATVVNAFGIIWPARQGLSITQNGQRLWIEKELFCTPSLILNPDDIIIFQTVQYRVMGKTDYSQFGYITYQLNQDYTGSG